ncbi:hypothetical protein LLG46_09440 [bacterium]|nr:hypothetical protein [bacterium]
MKYAKLTLISVMLIFAASVVWAQCPTCVQPQAVQCPTCVQPQVKCIQCCPSPQPCPKVCGCPCPSAVPAAMGAGPAADLQCLECPNFDPAYAQKMFGQYTTIAAVTAYGAQHANNSNLRAISREINGYMNSAASKLQGYYYGLTCSRLSVDCGAGQDIIAQFPCECFDGVYATTLSQLLSQARAADTLGSTRAVTPGMRQQAQFLTSKEGNWIFRLNRWVGDNQ